MLLWLGCLSDWLKLFGWVDDLIALHINRRFSFSVVSMIFTIFPLLFCSLRLSQRHELLHSLFPTFLACCFNQTDERGKFATFHGERECLSPCRGEEKRERKARASGWSWSCWASHGWWKWWERVERVQEHGDEFQQQLNGNLSRETFWVLLDEITNFPKCSCQSKLFQLWVFETRSTLKSSWWKTNEITNSKSENKFWCYHSDLSCAWWSSQRVFRISRNFLTLSMDVPRTSTDSCWWTDTETSGIEYNLHSRSLRLHKS